MSFPTGLVRYYTCTQVEYNRLLNDGRIIDNALYYIRNWQAAEGNLSAISNDVTHVYLGKQLIGGAYRYPTGSVLLGGDPNSTKIGSDSWGRNNVFTATNSPNGYEDTILLGRGNTASDHKQIILGTGVDRPKIGTRFIIGEDGYPLLVLTNSRNLMLSAPNGNLAQSMELPPSSCSDNIIINPGDKNVYDARVLESILLGATNNLGNINQSTIMSSYTSISNTERSLVSTSGSKLNNISHSIIAGSGHSVSYLRGGLIIGTGNVYPADSTNNGVGAIVAGYWAKPNVDLALNIGAGTTDSPKSIMTLDWDGNGEISGLGQWRTTNNYTRLLLAGGSTRITTGPSTSNSLILESPNITIDSSAFVSINTHRIKLSSPISNGYVDVVGVRTPSKTNSYYAANVAYVEKRLTEVIGGAPGALDTLNELAAALGDDENFATTVTERFTSDELRISALETGKMAYFGDYEINRTDTTITSTITIPQQQGANPDGYTSFKLNLGNNTLNLKSYWDSTKSSQDLISLGNFGQFVIASPIISMPTATSLSLNNTLITGVANSTDPTSAVNYNTLTTSLANKMDKWGTVTKQDNNTTITHQLPGTLVIESSSSDSYISLPFGADGGMVIKSGGSMSLRSTGITMMLMDSLVSLSGSTTSGVRISGVKTPDIPDPLDAANVKYLQQCLTVTNW